MRYSRILLFFGLLAVCSALILTLVGPESEGRQAARKLPDISAAPSGTAPPNQATPPPTISTSGKPAPEISVNTEHCNPHKVLEENANSLAEDIPLSIFDPEQLLIALSSSDDPDDLAVMTMMRESKPTAVIETSMQVLAGEGSHELALASLLRSCAKKPEHTECSESLHDQVRKVNEHNGAYWFMLGNVMLAQGKEKKALALLNQAASAPQYDTLWISTISAFNQALKRHFEFPDHESALHAVGLASAVALDNYEPVFELCKQEGVSFTYRRSVCAGFAEQLENNGMTLFDLTIGLVLQFRMAQLEGDKDLVESIESRRAANRLKQQHNLEATAALLLKGIDVHYDPALTMEYMQGLSVFGELPMLDYAEQVYERQFGPLPECG